MHRNYLDIELMLVKGKKEIPFFRDTFRDITEAKSIILKKVRELKATGQLSENDHIKANVRTTTHMRKAA